jgi:hypothetical protein
MSSKAKQVAMSGKLASNCAILTRLEEFPPLIIRRFQSGMHKFSVSVLQARFAPTHKHSKLNGNLNSRDIEN